MSARLLFVLQYFDLANPPYPSLLAHLLMASWWAFCKWGSHEDARKMCQGVSHMAEAACKIQEFVTSVRSIKF